MTEEQPKWREGMDVRARYGFESNAQYFEAKLLKIFDDDYAMVEFYGTFWTVTYLPCKVERTWCLKWPAFPGYSGEQVAKLRELQPSDGKEAIADQVAIAEGKWEDGDEEDESDVSAPSEAIILYSCSLKMYQMIVTCPFFL